MASLLQAPVNQAVDALLKGKSRVKILEAGCGSASQIQFTAAMHVVGIDISTAQLEKNVSLEEKILGDIQNFPLPDNEFDAIVCWMVLEHLPRPKNALTNMFRSVKPGGLLILGIPNLASIKGIATKLTPFWFHALFYRFMKYKSRHFPTYLRAGILPGRITRFAEASGFSVAFCKMVEGGVVKRLKSRLWVARAAFSTADVLWRVLTFGAGQSLLLDECAMILRKCDGAAEGRPSGSSRQTKAAISAVAE